MRQALPEGEIAESVDSLNFKAKGSLQSGL